MAQAKKGTPNFRWSTSYSEFAIKYLADLAKEGLKVDKAFKNTAYVKTAEAVNANFKINDVDVKKVMSHYKTIKSWWETIQNAKNLSGNGNYFDEETYTIGMDADTAREYIAAHPKAEKWINRPIPLYNEMQIICGNDRATGEYMTTSSRPLGTSQPISDGAIELDSEDIFDDSAPLDGHEVPDPTPTPSPSPSVTSRGNKPTKSKKRVHDEEEISVAENLKDISRGFNRYADLLETSMAVRFEHLDQKKIYAEVFALEEKGYSEDELYDIYVHLIKEEKDARIFIGAQERIRLKWVDEFLNGRRSGYRPTDPFPFNDSVM